jgi:hypothetical protein
MTLFKEGTMTIRLASFLVLLAFYVPAGMAEDKRPKKDTTSEDKREIVAQRKAEEVAQATVKGEYGKLADLTYPKVVEEMGGRDRMIAVLKNSLQEMNKKGFEFRSAKVGKTAQVVAGGDSLFAVVPFDLEMKVPGGSLAVKSFMLGISPDKGKTWTFINGDKVQDGSVKKMLPNLPAELKLPKKEQPVFHKDR